MRKIIFLMLIVNVFLWGVNNMWAQTYQHVPINGFNQDVIANGIGTVASSTTSDVDGATYCFRSIDWKLTATSAAQTSGFPLNGTITSAVSATPGLTYQLQDYSENNSIRLSPAPNTNTITSLVSGAISAKKLFVLVTSGSTASNLECVVTFQDDTTESFLTNEIPDWFGGTNPPVAFSGFGRVSRSNNNSENPFGNPRLYQLTLNISPSNQLKELKSIKFTRGTTSGGVLNVFAVTAELLGTCPNPEQVTVGSITPTTAVVNFLAPAILPINGYDYEVRSTGAPGSGASGLVTSGNIANTNLSINLSNLPSAQTLQFYIRSNCDETANDGWSEPIVFTMACAPVITDYLQNFDSTPVGNSSNPSPPNCWKFLSDGFGYGYTYDYNAFSAPNCFFITNSFSSSGNYILVGPETVDLGNGTKQLRFVAKSGSDGTQLIIGTMSNQNLASTFTPIANGTLELTTDYEEYIILLPAGTNDYFAFKHGLNGYYASIYIDDVNYETIPTCQGIVFGSATATNITNVQATLSWESLNDNFDIEYGLEGFEPGSGTLLTNVSNNYLLTQLSQSTTYSFYVRSNCAGNQQSPWRGPINFTTQTLVPSPWFEGFTSSFPTGWSNNLSGAEFGISNSINGLIPATGYFLYRNIYQEISNGSGVTTLNVGPILDNDLLSFNYKMALYSSPYGPVSSLAGSIDVMISTDFGVTYSQFANIPYNEVEGWQNFESTLDAYIGEIVKVKLVVNYNYEPYPNTIDHNLGLDNFFIGSCKIPAVPQVIDTSMDSATFSLEGLESDSYEVEYGEVDFEQGTGTVVVVTGTSFTISDLSPSTTYEYYIRRICETNFSPILGKFNFTTACDVFGAFVENFDTTQVGDSSNPSVPICWTVLNEGQGYATVYGSFSNSEPNSFLIYNGSDNTNNLILISPETVNLGEGNYRVTFRARTDYQNGNSLKFGTMSNKLDSSTFTELFNFVLTEEYQDFIVYLPAGTDDYFAFKHGLGGTYRSLIIDDVVYEPNPDCAQPINLGSSLNLLDLTAELTWTGPSMSANDYFEIQWGEAGFELGEGTIVTSNLFSTNISSLVLDESYSFYVRKICSDQETEWAGPYVFDMGYCTSDHTYVDGGGIANINIGGNIIQTTEDSYQYFSDTDVTIQAGELINSSITFNTGYPYGVNIFIDLNHNGVFESNERLFNGYNSSYNDVVVFNTNYTIPNNDNNLTGTYRMRIVTRDSTMNTPSPCDNSMYGVTIDLNLNIVFPCIAPTNVVTEDVGFDYVVLNWFGQEGAEYELEYGLSGFAHGSGTIITNVEQPYTLEGLISGRTYDFYVRKKCGNVYSDWSVTTAYVFCNQVEPTGANEQTLVQDQLLSDLVIEGSNLKYYSDPELTQEVPASTAVQANGTYFVTQTTNCESDSYLIVQLTVIPRIAQPIVNATQNFCDGGTIQDIPITSLPGATVIWYSSLTSTTELPITTQLQTGNYYVVQTDGVTISHRKLINIVVNPTPVNLISQPINLCGNYTFGSLTINNIPGTTVKWYSSPNSITPISNNTQVTSGTYYVTQSFGVCESQRVAFQVSQFESLNKPVADIQTFCGSGTVADLVAVGVQNAEMLWYSSATSTSVLANSTVLSTGTYYVAQTINGCYSDRRAVAVRVVTVTAPQVSPFVICNSGTISDLHITSASGVTYKWYNSPSSTTELTQSTPLATGTYFVERIQSGCVSARTAVQVTIASIPNTPTGASTQTFIEGSTIGNLILNQPDVIWYITYNDSQNGVNPLSSNLPLVNGTTYYAVIMGANGCPSLPFAVTVDVYLSNNEFVKEELKYYPNPVVDILSLTYSEKIAQIEVFDLLGKRVKVKNTDDTNVDIDLSDLSSGTYMIQLKTETKSQFIKIIKK